MTLSLSDLMARLKRSTTAVEGSAAAGRTLRKGEEIEAARLAAMVRAERAHEARMQRRRMSAGLA